MMAYLDYNATTPMHPLVKEAFIKALDTYGNPSSMHSKGKEALFAIETTRYKIKSFINCKSKEQIIFTASATEANNLVIQGATQPYLLAKEKAHLITSKIEHPSVLYTFKYLESLGFPVSYLGVDKYGQVNLKELKSLIRESTKLISVNFASNEIGTIQPIREIITIAQDNKILFHSDAVQALGKIKVDIKELDLDFMSFSAHKIYGPKGLGFLYVRNKKMLRTILHGGSHEYNLRPGTENVPAIIALDKCIETVADSMEKENKKIKRLKDKLENAIIKLFPKAIINGHKENRIPNTLNVSFSPLESSAIMLKLDLEKVYVSTGSACASKDTSPSYVISALGKSKEIASSSIRFSLGWQTTEEEVNYAIKSLAKTIEELRRLL